MRRVCALRAHLHLAHSTGAAAEAIHLKAHLHEQVGERLVVLAVEGDVPGMLVRQKAFHLDRRGQQIAEGGFVLGATSSQGLVANLPVDSTIAKSGEIAAKERAWVSVAICLDST